MQELNPMGHRNLQSDMSHPMYWCVLLKCDILVSGSLAGNLLAHGSWPDEPAKLASAMNTIGMNTSPNKDLLSSVRSGQNLAAAVPMAAIIANVVTP